MFEKSITEENFQSPSVNIPIDTDKSQRAQEMNVVQGLKRIPRIKFPQRHLKPSEGKKQVEDEAATFFFSNLNTQKTVSGKASVQPKRTPVSTEEMEAILLGGCI